MVRHRKIETTWLREYASHYLPCDAALEYAPEALRRAGLDLLDLIHLLRRGRVVYAEKLDGPGALWIVEGHDLDRNNLRATLVVTTQELSVRVVEVERLQREQGAKINAA